MNLGGKKEWKKELDSRKECFEKRNLLGFNWGA